MTEQFDIRVVRAEREQRRKEDNARTKSARKAWLSTLTPAEKRSHYALQGLKGAKMAGELALLYVGGTAALMEGHNLATSSQPTHKPTLEHHFDGPTHSKPGTGILTTKNGKYGIGTAVAVEKSGDHPVHSIQP